MSVQNDAADFRSTAVLERLLALHPKKIDLALDRILRLLQSPYDSHPGDEAFAAPPAPEFNELSVSCSS